MNRTSTPLVLIVSAAVLVLGLFLGVRLVTAQADTSSDAPTCTDRTVKTGQTLSSNLVQVNVYNASQRAGLANRVSINLQRRGFLAGGIGNTTSKGPGVTIVDADKDDPRVRLVAAQFGRVSYATSDLPKSEGVTLVIGDRFSALKRGAKNSLKSSRDVTVCTPTVTLDQ